MALKPVDKEQNPGLAKLPTDVRNKMGFAKKGGCIKRTKHDMGGAALPAYSGYNNMMAPAPSAAKFGHKKGKMVKREHHFLGALLGAASAIPALIDLFRKK